MTIWNLGSINADLVYRVRHLPAPGETLAATERRVGLGGKGANMSVAAARAGSHVVHLGSVGQDGGWMVDRLMEYGVDTRGIVKSGDVSGHAVIAVDDQGENTILLHPGANRRIAGSAVAQMLDGASDGDLFLTQNETNAQAEIAQAAKARGLRVVYAAAPFDADAVRALDGLIDLLVLNAVEARQLEDEAGRSLNDLDIGDIVVTLGAEGCRWIDRQREETLVPALKVDPVDTTGAGDTFTGYLVAGLDRGQPMRQALTLATRAAALMVTRAGTADVIPDLKEIEDWVLR